MNMKLEVVMLGVSDVDRAKAFYEKAGFRLDIDYVADEKFRALQFTPPRSDASIIFGKGVNSTTPGSAELVLAVEDVDVAREELVGRGIKVSEVFHYAGGPFNNSVENPRVAGRAPDGRSYFSFASFEDPDGNRWQLQEIKERLPGREWKAAGGSGMDVATLAELLHETEQHHGGDAKTHGKKQSWELDAAHPSGAPNRSKAPRAPR